MGVEFFNFWVQDLWGSALMTFFGTGLIFAIIGVMGKMSYFLLTTMLILYFTVFGIAFYGMLFWLPLFLFSFVYFVFQIYKFTQRTD